ncbi:helix-turn-helix transcriptional regulator [Streptomyces sp. ISL-98]|uniref:helix-turn-helix domain-containing protein n=1 Tax=Streptomyces sp. ISL-98 TaxID=2819192 RepID=UPI001BEBA0DC|nr:helix-turn-helix transcriptional regulator [Streptomyces sp. ISL-98]MBT2508665.1 helix-turn-helix transcriptional regulator [Streptomyces sp. ISL-98]
MLETLGVSPLSEQIYRSMLAYPDEGVSALALRHGIGESEARQSLNQLSALALIRPSESDGSGFHPVSPELAMESLLARQQARLAAEQSKVEASRAAAAQLIAEYSVLRPSGSHTDQLVGVDAIRERLAQLGKAAESEVMTFAPGGAHSPSDLAASRGPNTTLLDRGVRMRTIYLDSVRNDQPTVEHVTWLHSRGGEVRTTASLPTRLIIVDRKQALLPTQLVDARNGAVLVRSEGTIAALCALFESMWSAATPFGTKPKLDPRGLPGQEAEVLRLLAKGLTDEAIAKKLGVSPRTARRIAAELMERLAARSRFEAGVHAVQDGWLPPTR